VCASTRPKDQITAQNPFVIQSGKFDDEGSQHSCAKRISVGALQGIDHRLLLEPLSSCFYYRLQVLRRNTVEFVSAH